MPKNVSEKIRYQVQTLEKVTTKFQDFRKLDPKFNLLAYQISTDVDTAPDKLQLVFIDMQSDHTLTEMLKARGLVNFYKSLSDDKCPCVKKFARKMCIFGATYKYVSKIFPV